MAKFLILLTNGGLYRFNLVANNGEVILQSESYTTRSACLNAISSIKHNSLYDESYEKNSNMKGVFFYFKARNGEILGRSNTYTTIGNRDNAINIVKQIAQSAIIQD